ncbi:MAG: asparagine synthase (glutamine-hydrolyzing) [Cyclobacteriaceae bacterium]
MCGIAGFSDFTKRSNESVLKAMTDVIAYRGPDDQGQFIKDLPNTILGLGHRRLSILDLSPLGHQPYFSRNLALIFNGEIYNFKEVRATLIKKGYSFLSNSDTEVIIKAYDAYGISCVNEFIGMFAFALLDADREKLFLVRDRAGVKPMYYSWKNDVLLFGSELKSFHEHPAFRKEIDYNSLALYFQYSYIPAPYTVFKDTFKLRPGHILEMDLKRKTIQTTSYWNVVDHYNKPKLSISYREAEEELERLLKSACEYRMVADVPVGVFLSGGYDSTAVAALLQSGRTEKLKTFTIGFDDAEFNESVYAKKVAQHLGTEHTEHYCSKKEIFDIVPTLADIYDEPFGDNSIVPTTLVSQVAVKQVKVALSADGGDEIFAGYSKFNMSLNYTQMLPIWAMQLSSKGMGLLKPEYLPFTDRAFNFNTRYRKLQMIMGKPEPVHALKIISQFNIDSELKKKFTFEYEDLKTDFDINGDLNDENDAINRMLAIDYKTFLVDNNLTKVDRATMSVSLEGREPLLDHRIIEFVAQLPSHYKLDKGKTKVILKNIVHKYVPPSIMDRPKMGFIAPVMKWLRSEMRDVVHEHINEVSLKESGIFNHKEILRLRNRFLEGKSENVQKLWHLLVFQMWRKRWM